MFYSFYIIGFDLELKNEELVEEKAFRIFRKEKENPGPNGGITLVQIYFAGAQSIILFIPLFPWQKLTSHKSSKTAAGAKQKADDGPDTSDSDIEVVKVVSIDFAVDPSQLP